MAKGREKKWIDLFIEPLRREEGKRKGSRIRKTNWIKEYKLRMGLFGYLVFLIEF